MMRGICILKRVVDNERLMARVCELYYNQNLGQKEISSFLNLSRPTVSRLLIRARQTGVVRVIIANFSGRNHLETEQGLERKYNIKTAIVTDTFDDREQQLSELGRAAAKYLERILRDGDIIGISMGSTLSHIAPHVSADYFRDIKVVPMLGGIGNTAMELHANSLAEVLAKQLNGESLALHAPAMVSRIQAKKELLQEQSIASILELASSPNVALSGIGAPAEESTIIATGYFNREMIEDFKKFDICGDICMNFYDKKGHLSLYECNQRVIGVNIETLRKVPWSFGVTGGVEKADAIRGALAGKYINVLVTDYECAKRLLEE